jgi:histidine triad (HIT) family protein
MMKCVFCEILKGALPADIVYQSEHVSAFLDTRPLFPGHTLIVPKVHFETIWDVPASLSAHLFDATRLLSVAIKNALNADGIFTANNNIISQSVPHFHIHVVPRKKKDGLTGFFWPRVAYTNDQHKQEIRDKIIKAIAEMQ